MFINCSQCFVTYSDTSCDKYKTAFCVTLHRDKLQDEKAAHITPPHYSVDMCIMCHIQRDKLCNKLEISVSGWCMWYIESFIGSVYSQLTDWYSFVRAIK